MEGREVGREVKRKEKKNTTVKCICAFIIVFTDVLPPLRGSLVTTTIREDYQGDMYSARRAVMDNVSLGATGRSSHRWFGRSGQVKWQYKEYSQLDIGVLQLSLEPLKLPKCCLLSVLC